jgi:hypothetical protein
LETYEKQIAEFKQLLREHHQHKHNMSMYENDDLWILRFLLNPIYSTSECVNRYVKMIRLREENGLNHIKDLIFEQINKSQDPVCNFPYFEIVNKAFPESLYHTNDIWGQPVAIQLLGKSDLTFLTENLCKSEFYQYALWKAEYMRIILDMKSHETQHLLQWVQVIDLEGLGFAHVNPTAFDYLKSASNRIDQIYKECFGNIYIVNVPGAFHFIWSIMCLWVSPRTAQKITLLDDADYKQKLRAIISDSEKWPYFLGGDQFCVTIANLHFIQPQKPDNDDAWNAVD